MKKPRKITLEIITNDDTNAGPILALLEACRWLHNGYGNSVSENDTTEITMRNPKPGPSIDLTTCDKCGNVKPINDPGCFGCLTAVVRAGLELIK